MALNDADYDTITVDLIFTKGAACVPKGLIEALESLNLRFNLRRPSDSENAVFASTEANNLTRIDSVGGIYTPAVKKVLVESRVVNLSETNAPGDEVVALIPAPGIADLANAVRALTITRNPASEPVDVTSYTVSGTNLRIGFTRLAAGQTSPYVPVAITISGALYEFPQPEPAA